MKSVLVALAVWLITTVLTIDFIYQAGISEGQRIKSADVKLLIEQNKDLLSEVCYAWWFKTPPKDKKLSGSRKKPERNFVQSGTNLAQR